MLRQFSLVLCLLLLAGCGVETAGTAATVAAMKAKEAEQAKNTRDQIHTQIDAAMALGQQRLQDAERDNQ